MHNNKPALQSLAKALKAQEHVVVSHLSPPILHVTIYLMPLLRYYLLTPSPYSMLLFTKPPSPTPSSLRLLHIQLNGSGYYNTDLKSNPPIYYTTHISV